MLRQRGEILTGGNIDIDMLPPNQPNDVIDEKLFAVINLDYRGLEKAKNFIIQEILLCSK